MVDHRFTASSPRVEDPRIDTEATCGRAGRAPSQCDAVNNDNTPVKAPSAPLRAVVPMHVAAALLGVPCRAFAKCVRRGEVTGAVRGLDSIGYIVGWRAMDRLLADRLNDDALVLARVLLLDVRSGAVRVEGGEFLPVDGYEPAPADRYLDEELEGEVARAARALGDAVLNSAEFDRWAAENGSGLRHRDVAVRLNAATWAATVRVATDGEALEEAISEQADLSDPVVALQQAAATVGDGRGRELSTGKFDDWAEEHGCPLRSGQVRSQWGGWNRAKSAAGLEIAPQGRRRR